MADHLPHKPTGQAHSRQFEHGRTRANQTFDFDTIAITPFFDAERGPRTYSSLRVRASLALPHDGPAVVNQSTNPAGGRPGQNQRIAAVIRMCRQTLALGRSLPRPPDHVQKPETRCNFCQAGAASYQTRRASASWCPKV